MQHAVWLLTRENNGPAIEAEMAAEPELRITPVYLDLPEGIRFWKYWPGGTQLYYWVWQYLAWKKARALHREVSFDVGHHLTFAVDWMPAGIAWVKDLRVVWGPVGGATNMPWRLWRWLGWRGIVAEVLREAVTRPARRLFGDVTAKRVAVVVAQNHDVAKRFPQARHIRVEPNVAVAALTGDGYVGPRAGAPTAVFVGRLIPWKGLRLAIAALAQPAGSAWRLEVYGEGGERRRAESMADELQVRNRLVFHGQQPRATVLEALQRADVLLQPSLHDAAGWVVAEAVTAGGPVVCLDLGGPAVLVESTGGRALPAEPGVETQLAQALREVEALRDEQRVPSTRWTAHRLHGTLDSLYGLAIDGR